MNRGIDYSSYDITSTSQFDNGLAELKEQGFHSEVKKLFRIIDEIILGEEMYDKEYSRPLKDSPKVYHIHLDGRQTGDIILLYTVEGRDINLDLRLYNITDHKSLSNKSNKKFIQRQGLHSFDVIRHKFSQEQIDYAEECYLDLISDYKFHQLSSQKRVDYTESYLRRYLDENECSDPVSYDEFLQLINYFENIHQKSIFGSLNLSKPVHCAAITQREIDYILDMIADYGLIYEDAYIETEVDTCDITYETMYVSIVSDDSRILRLFESELYSLKDLFNIGFDSSRNGLGRFGKTYEFFHYFD